jgi:putative ABC transport system permease protein
MKKTFGKLLLVAACAVPMSLVSCSEPLTQIGILQVITHNALGLDRTGFIEELKDEGYEDGKNIKIITDIPEGDTSTENSMATQLATSCDLVFGIATSSALALKTAVSDANKSIPVLYSAVTDPVSAKLIKSNTDHGNVVGTSDAGPTEKNIALFKKFTGIEKIGMIYNQAESNSQVQKEECKAACQDLGLTYVDGGITSASEIASTVAGMIGQGIKGLFIPTDNTVASAMSSLKETLIEKKIVTVCADKASTDNGGSLGYSVDYSLLGKTTGKMAAKLLKGEDISTLVCSKSDSFPLEVNEDFFTATGIALPSDIEAE